MSTPSAVARPVPGSPMTSSSSTGDAMMRLIKRLTTDDRGAAIAEFMLGLVPLVLALAIIFEFGRAFWSHQAVIKGVRDATRFLTRVENPSDPSAQAVAQSLLLTSQQGPGGVQRWASGSTARFGTMCSDPSAPCAAVATQTCTGAAGNAVVDEIFGTIQPLLPTDATPANLQFHYESTGLGFLGGPYVPMTSINLQSLQHA